MKEKDLEFPNFEFANQLKSHDIIENTLLRVLNVEHKEVQLSNLLGHFFHRDNPLSQTFFSALVTLLKEKTDEKLAENLNFGQGDYEVVLEELTQNSEVKDTQQKRIDIILRKPGEWAIIIENKVNHTLVNPLRAYWDHIREDNKLLVVLSPRREHFGYTRDENNPLTYIAEIDHNKLISITHLELKNAVQFLVNKLEVPGIDNNYILMEYYSAIENICSHQRNLEFMKENIKLFKTNKKEIKELLETSSEISKTIKKEINNIAERMRLSVSNCLTNDLLYEGVHISAEGAPNRRIYVAIGKLKFEDKLEVYLEFFGTEVNKKEFSDFNSQDENQKNNFPFEAADGKGPGYQHIAKIEIEDFIEQNGEQWSAKLEEYLKKCKDKFLTMPVD